MTKGSRIPDGSQLLFVRPIRRKIGISEKGKELYRSFGLYICFCGTEFQARMSHVKCGHTKSCGCNGKSGIITKKTNHGLSKHPLYRVWNGMKQRCYNKNSLSYSSYGGIGVKICDEWLVSFKSFYNWSIKNEWEIGLELDKDKIAKSKNIKPLLYSPETCCFITKKENSNIKRNNNFITHNGETKSVSQWAEVLEIKKSVIFQRISLGWDKNEALSTKVIKKQKNYKLAKLIIDFFEKNGRMVSVENLSTFLNTIKSK